MFFRRLDRTHLRRNEEHSENEMLRPGFSRLNLPYFMTDKDIDFVLEAVKMVAEEGWKLLPQYKLNNETGEWRHHHFNVCLLNVISQIMSVTRNSDNAREEVVKLD